MFSAFMCLCFGYRTCEASEKENKDGAYKLLSTAEGVVLFHGWDNGSEINYDIGALTEKQKEEYSNKGLKVMAERFESADSHKHAALLSEILTGYYFLKKDTKKAMYWCLKAAENGSSLSMWALANAYKAGDGVVQDLEEGIKWTYLGAAAGDESCKQWVKEHGVNLLLSESIAPILKEGQKRAKSWMEAHRELFFTPN